MHKQKSHRNLRSNKDQIETYNPESPLSSPTEEFLEIWQPRDQNQYFKSVPSEYDIQKKSIYENVDDIPRVRTSTPLPSPDSVRKLLDWDLNYEDEEEITLRQNTRHIQEFSKPDATVSHSLKSQIDSTYQTIQTDSDSNNSEYEDDIMAGEMYTMYAQIGKYVPTFSGIGDAKSINVEQFFRSLENATEVIGIKDEPVDGESAIQARERQEIIREEKQRKICLLKLEGDALEYVQMLPARTRENYQLLKSAIKERYSDGMCASDYNRELATITQGSYTVKELIAKISKLVEKSIEHLEMAPEAAQNYKDTVAMNTMLRALNPDVLDRVMMYQPDTWEGLQKDAIKSEIALRTLRTCMNKTKGNKFLAITNVTSSLPPNPQSFGDNQNLEDFQIQFSRDQKHLCRAVDALSDKISRLNLGRPDRLQEPYKSPKNFGSNVPRHWSPRNTQPGWNRGEPSTRFVPRPQMECFQLKQGPKQYWHPSMQYNSGRFDRNGQRPLKPNYAYRGGDKGPAPARNGSKRVNFGSRAPNMNNNRVPNALHQAKNNLN